MRYFPSWMEVAASLALVAMGFGLFGLAVRYLPIFPAATEPEQEADALSWAGAAASPALAGPFLAVEESDDGMGTD